MLTLTAFYYTAYTIMYRANHSDDDPSMPSRRSLEEVLENIEIKSVVNDDEL